MKKDEHSGFRDLVSVIAACGFVLLVALTALLAQNGFGSLKDWLLMAPPLEESSTRAPEAAWTDNEIKAALMQCIQALAPITANVAPLNPMRDGDCGEPAPVLLKSIA